MNLTKNAIKTLQGSGDLKYFRPILKVISSENLAQSRFTARLSDGDHHMDAIIANQGNGLVISTDTYIKLKRYSFFPINDGQSRFVVHEFEVLQASNEPIKYTPISKLRPYTAGWILKAKVISRSQIILSKKDSGHHFIINLVDEQGDQIRGVFFKEASDKFEWIKSHKTYEFSKGQVLLEREKYQNSHNRYQIIFEEDAVIAPLAEDLAETILYTELKDVSTIIKGDYINICAIIKRIFPEVEVNAKTTGLNHRKKEMIIIDQGKIEMSLTI